MKSKIIRKTKRLILRPLAKSDYLAWRTAHSTMLPPKNKWDSKNKDESKLTKSEFYLIVKDQDRRIKNEIYFYYALFNKKTGEYLGNCGVGNFVRSLTQSAFLGYSLFNNHWGKGYAEEAVNALIDIAFNDHKLHRVVAGIESGNKKSIRLVKKLGFRREGVAKRVVLLRDEWQDLVQYALTTEDRKVKWTGSIEVRKK